ncbi:MAG: hypothetical protein J7556_22260 [Acidovorax sp.]|nr:hypothetical protein [Acidovorax sp.]
MPSNALTLSVNATGYNNSSWTSPANALVSNNAYATKAPGVTSNQYFAYDTNAASVLPVDAVIVGVVITVEYKVSATALGPKVETAGPAAGSGIPLSNSEPPIIGTTADVVYTVGSPTNPLGATSRDSLTTMALRLNQATSGSVTHYIDNATMTVYWDYPSTGNVLFFGEPF